MQENLYKKIKNGIKKGVYTIVGIGLVSFVLATGVFAQEGTTIDDKVNEEPNPTKISDEIKEEPEYFKEISDKINQSFQEKLVNSLEIGGKPAYKEIINGQEYYFVEGFDYALLRLKIENKDLLSYTQIVNHAIGQGFKEVVSAMYYNPKEINFFNNSIEKQGEEINFFNNSIEKQGEGTYAYIKTDIKNTKSSTQDKEE